MRAGHILGVDVVLAECVAVVLPAIQGHAGDRTRLRAKLVDEILVRPPATDPFSALRSARRRQPREPRPPVAVGPVLLVGVLTEPEQPTHRSSRPAGEQLLGVGQPAQRGHEKPGSDGRQQDLVQLPDSDEAVPDEQLTQPYPDDGGRSRGVRFRPRMQS